MHCNFVCFESVSFYGFGQHEKTMEEGHITLWKKSINNTINKDYYPNEGRVRQEDLSELIEQSTTRESDLAAYATHNNYSRPLWDACFDGVF